MSRGTRYSAREGRWYGARQSNRPIPETERDEREFVTDLGNGMVRVDLGAPIARLPKEPQPVPVKPHRAARAPEAPASIELPTIPPASPRKAPRDPREFKPGINKDT